MSHFDTDGININAEVKETRTLKVKESLSAYLHESYNVPDHVIYKQLAEQLAHELLKEKLITITKSQNHVTLYIDFIASITVTPANIKFHSVEDEVFVVNGERFTEEEVIAAIKETYPERLL